MRGLDERLARLRGIEQLARWWHSASQEARFALWRQAATENRPPFETLRLAIIAAEIEAGEVSEG